MERPLPRRKEKPLAVARSPALASLVGALQTEVWAMRRSGDLQFRLLPEAILKLPYKLCGSKCLLVESYVELKGPASRRVTPNTFFHDKK